MIAPEIEQLAKQAAVKVMAELIDMLVNGKEGEVAAILGFNEIQVERRPKDVVWRKKIERGRWTVIRRAK